MELNDKLKELHIKHFGKAPEVLSFAPGRAEVLGNHTDYNGGRVLSMAIAQGHCFAISPNKGEGLRLLAGDLEVMASFTLDEISPVENAPWASYVKGVFYFLKQRGLDVDNWDCSFLGDIPVGSGLSSSAALEVSAAWAAQEMCSFWLPPMETAELCRESESRFAGCNCGLLDQISSIYGKEQRLIHSDFSDLTVDTHTLSKGLSFLRITPEITHSLADSPYNQRRESCHQALEELRISMKTELPSLGKATTELLKSHETEISPEPFKRALHVVGETERVAQSLKAIDDEDGKALGDMMFQSHLSSMENFENSAVELDTLVEISRSSGVLGARLSGGGWGGSLILLCHSGKMENLKKNIIRSAGEAELKIHIDELIPSRGAFIIQKRSTPQ